MLQKLISILLLTHIAHQTLSYSDVSSRIKYFDSLLDISLLPGADNNSGTFLEHSLGNAEADTIGASRDQAHFLLESFPVHLENKLSRTNNWDHLQTCLVGTSSASFSLR
jgi:hypothetical protein